MQAKNQGPHITEFTQACGNAVSVWVFGKGQQKAAPLLLYFHGGLFNSGTVEAAEPLAHALAATAVVTCVDYPLAPKLHFPTTVEVAFDALLWAAANHARLIGQILINPMLDPQQTTPSMQEAEDSPCRKAWSDYLPCISDALHPYAAPILSKRLGGLVPALIISGERDPLRDEAEQYAAKLIAAGVPVQVRRLKGARGSLVQAGHSSFDHVVQLIGQFVAESA